MVMKILVRLQSSSVAIALDESMVIEKCPIQTKKNMAIRLQKIVVRDIIIQLP